MENRGSKGLALAALLVGVVGLTIGFAAFSAQLTINSSASYSNIEQEAEFKNAIYLVDEQGSKLSEGAEITGSMGSKASVDTNAAGVMAVTVAANKFTAPGQTETFTLRVKNASNFVAYPNVTSGNGGTPTCGTVTGLTKTACESLTLSVTGVAQIDKNGTNEITVTVDYPAGSFADEVFTGTFAPVVITYSTAQ